MRAMRVLTLILILAISAQPLQAGSCAMGMDQGQAGAVDMPMDMDMDHGDGHDCCDTEASEAEESCEGGSHCGHCTVVSPALTSIVRVPVAWQPAGEFALSRGVLLPSHSSPPFRPPIS